MLNNVPAGQTVATAGNLNLGLFGNWRNCEGQEIWRLTQQSRKEMGDTWRPWNEDELPPPEHPTALWRHWGEPAIHWFSGSHLAPFGRGRIVRAIVSHLESLDIL